MQYLRSRYINAAVKLTVFCGSMHLRFIRILCFGDLLFCHHW